jgi:hypothetical protein
LGSTFWSPNGTALLAVGAVTAAVRAEAAEFEPPALDAVTTERSMCPTLAEATV